MKKKLHRNLEETKVQSDNLGHLHLNATLSTSLLEIVFSLSMQRISKGHESHP